MNFSAINKCLCIVCLLLASISCLAQKKSDIFRRIEDTLTYKQGNEKISRILFRDSINYKQLYKNQSHWINEEDWKTMNSADTICHRTDMISPYWQQDSISFRRWRDTWNQYFSRYLGNAFWRMPHPGLPSRISLWLEKGKSCIFPASIEISKDKYIYYKIKCTKANRLRSDTTRKLCVFKFYRHYFLYKTKGGEYQFFTSPFPSGKITYLHNVGFIAIKFPKDKMLRLKCINGYPWKEYVNKINPGYRYFALKSRRYLQ